MSLKKNKSKGRNFFNDEPWIRYASIIVALYLLLLFLRKVYPILVANYIPFLKEVYPEFMTGDDIQVNRQFVEWFGVLYGFLLPLILVKVWDQFEALEREFDRELDSVKMLYEDLLLLPNKIIDHKIISLNILLMYVTHTTKHYIDEASKNKKMRENGNNILISLRKEFSVFFEESGLGNKYSPLITQLLNQLNIIIDVRGDRISNSKQRLFSSLRSVAVLASIVWLIPFYFMDFEMGMYGDLLVFTVTALIVFVLHLIEDLDEPFFKNWRLETDAWEKLKKDLIATIKELKN